MSVQACVLCELTFMERSHEQILVVCKTYDERRKVYEPHFTSKLMQKTTSLSTFLHCVSIIMYARYLHLATAVLFNGGHILTHLLLH